MKKTILALSAAALALTGTTAIAQYRGAGHNADTNGDGTVTLAEMQSQSAERFARMDANGDGVLDAQDRAARGEAMFARADTNGDGELTIAEMQAAREARKAERPERGDRPERAERRGKRGGDRSERMAERFAAADTDNSGGLSQSELKAMHEARGERRQRGKRGMRMLERVDTNGDKAISRAEFDAAAMARFTRLDSNADGAISAAERDAAKAERKQRREQRRGQ
ncbi:MAG: EF-hand domain-containing protein [Pseudomonadota bacterium]|nr:EF-hand domain-containing protein [Pseudomonadota bacterium]